MKIAFNPTIKNYKTYSKSFKIYASKDLKQVSLNALDCVANYNFSFGTRAVYALDYDGSYEKFSRVGKAIEKYGQSVNSVLSGEHSASGDKIFLYADSVEFPDGSVNDKIIKIHGNVLYNSDGTYKLDEEKVKYIGVIDKTRRVYEIKLD